MKAARRKKISGVVAYSLVAAINTTPFPTDLPAVTSNKKITSDPFVMFEATTYEDIMKQLTDHAVSTQKGVEGGLFMHHGESKSLKADWQSKRKRECLLLELSFANPKSILEVGFNAGHSSAMFMSSSPEVSIHAFDICRHSYTQPAADALKNMFEGRLMLTCGDSATTIPAFRKELEALPVEQRTTFDFLFIDGDHRMEKALLDIVNSCSIAEESATVVVDDCEQGPVLEAWNEAVKQKIVRPIHWGLCWVNTCYGRCNNDNK